MKFALILSLVLCCFYSINCLNATFYKICNKEDFFDYENSEVNAVYVVKLHLPLPPVNHFTISKSIDFNSWTKNSNELLEINEKRDEYNKLVTNFHTSDNLNNLNVSAILKTKYDILAFRDYFASWYTKIGFNERLALNSIQKTMQFTNKMISNLVLLKRDQINEKIVDEKTALYLSTTLQDKLSKDYLGTLIFKDHKHYHYYTQRIAKLDKIDVNSRNNTFSLFIPVNNFYPSKTAGCLTINDLPTFYKENNLKYV